MSTDEFIYKQALESDEPDRPFLSKNLVYIQDLNPTSYATNEIVFETAFRYQVMDDIMIIKMHTSLYLLLLHVLV